MPFPINAAHRLVLEDGTSFLLLEDNTSKLIIDEPIALDDPLNAATSIAIPPALTFVGQNLAVAGNLHYEVQIDTVNTFDSQ